MAHERVISRYITNYLNKITYDLYTVSKYVFERLVSSSSKLQALVYDILPSTTAVFIYAIGSRKLSANEHFVVVVVVVVVFGAQTVVTKQLRLYQTFVL